MFEELKERFSITKTELVNANIDKFFVNKNQIKEILKVLKDSPEYCFDMLLSLCCMDNNSNLELAYTLYSTQSEMSLVIAVELTREAPVVDTVSDIFKSANWDEREIFDLFGVKFTSHPDLKRILLPKDWKGYPLRKDYVQDDERLYWNR